MIIVARPPFAQQFNIFKALSARVSYTYNVSLSGTLSFSPWNKKFVFVKSTSKQKIPNKKMGCLRQNQAC